jgi:hypothetical protein
MYLSSYILPFLLLTTYSSPRKLEHGFTTITIALTGRLSALPVGGQAGMSFTMTTRWRSRNLLRRYLVAFPDLRLSWGPSRKPLLFSGQSYLA